MNKKMFLATVMMLSSFFFAVAHAQGVLTLEGVVTQRTPDSITLKVDESEFRIRRSKLAEFQEKEIEKARAKITLQVPLDAIENIRTASAK